MVDIFEVGPRDGFQNVSKYIDLEVKKRTIDLLVQSGVKNIQHTSFVSPKAIPQMKDAKELTEYCLEKYPEINFFSLIPNLKGAEIAASLNINYVSYVVSLSESHNKANINRTHEESFDEYMKIRNEFPNMKICLDLSTTFGCPFEGKFTAQQVVDFVQRYVENGIDELNLCDTIGVSYPNEVEEIIQAVQKNYPHLELQIHIHDTRNMGMLNTYVALKNGVKKLQSAIGGLGGCPFAPGASGNLASEDLVSMLNGMGLDTGIQVDKIIEAAKYVKLSIPEGNFSGHLINIE